MKTKILFILLMCLSLSLSAQEDVIIESMRSTQVTNQYISPEADNIRLVNTAGAKLILTDHNEETWYTLEREAAILHAFKYWEEKLPVNDPINVEVVFRSLPNNVLSQVTLKTNSSPNLRPNIQYPTSLLKHLKQSSSTAVFDISITYNSNILWYYGIDGSVPANQYDFVTETLRAITRGLGFFSPVSIVTTANGSIARKTSNNIFSCFIENSDQTTLNLLPMSGTTLDNFIKSGDLYWNGIKGGRQKMFAPSTPINGVSSHYFDSNSNNDPEKMLMKPYMDVQQSIHQIGSKVVDILSDMGWEMANNNLYILSNQITENGAMQLNNTYTFTATAGWGNISTYNWNFELMNESGEYTIQSTGNSSNFSVLVNTPTVNQGELARLSNGALRGRVKLNTIDGMGNPIEKLFYVTVQYRPANPIINIVSVTSIDDWTQNVEIEFYADGATHYAILHEEIGEPFVFTKGTLAKKGYNRFIITNVYNESQHIFQVNASNAYGVSSTSISYDPTLSLQSNLQVKANVINSELQLQFQNRNQKSVFPKLKHIKVFDAMGRLEYTQPIVNFNELINLAGMKRGIHIVQIMDIDNNLYVSKIIIQ